MEMSPVENNYDTSWLVRDDSLLNRKKPSEYSIDIHKISSLVRKQYLEPFAHPLSDKCSIYRVPSPLRGLNEKAYTPQVVSIGPYHQGLRALKDMEEHKGRYLGEFLKLGHKVSLEGYVKFIKQKEIRLRNCYAETIRFSSEEFLRIILVDTAFIIMILLKSCFQFEFLLGKNDRLFTKPKMMNHIRNDMILLENQLPFFILADMFELSGIQDILQGEYDLPESFSRAPAMIVVTSLFFRNSFGIGIDQENYPSKVEHLLDYWRICYSSPKWFPRRLKIDSIHVPCIEELHQAGVDFRPASGSNRNPFDIKFDKGILEIPPIKIYKSTELSFRNLQAYEQCHCLENDYIRDYICLMGELVKTPKDVELLVQSRIILHWANNVYVSTLFQNLDEGNFVFTNHFGYAGLIKELNVHCASPWPRWKTTLKQDYFKTPWAIFSVMAAVILLLLTLVQTLCSIVQVIN